LAVSVTASKPAWAAPITFAPVWNGGDLTASATVPYSASDITTFTTQVVGPELGFPTTASVTDVARALMGQFETRPQLPSSTTGVAQPQQFPASVINTVTTTVTYTPICAPCATVTATIPAATVANWKVGISGLITFSGAWVSYYIGVFLAGLFVARGLPTTPPEGQTRFQQFVANRPGAWGTMLAIGYTIANFVELPINNLFLGQKLTPIILAPAFTFAILQFSNQKTAPWLTAWVSTYAGKISTAIFPIAAQVGSSLEMDIVDPDTLAQAQMLQDVKDAIDALATVITNPDLPRFLPGQFPAYFNDLPATAAREIRDALTLAFIDAAVEEGFPQLFGMAEAGGTITDYKESISPQTACLDGGYGESQPLVPGDIVAFNACNGNPNQLWTGWNTSNCTDPRMDNCVGVPLQIADNGLCLSPRDETSTGSQPLILAWCDGSTAQEWVYQHGTTFPNYYQQISDVANGLCVDLPGSNTTLGTPMQDYTCNHTNAQSWFGFGNNVFPSGGTPCDIYASAGTPCVAAYSTVRALSSNYSGPLYQVVRSDGSAANIGLLSTGGYVDASQQDSFCNGTPCTINVVYDQSGLGNNLTITGPSTAGGGADQGSPADALPITVGITASNPNGHKAYGMAFSGRTGYRDDNAHGTAVNGQPEGMYMVTSGTNVNNGCCFDFGNMEVNNNDAGDGHMDAVYQGLRCEFPPCSGSGPWVAADMENGLFQGGDGSNTNNLGDASNFVTAMLKNDGQRTYALKGGDAQSGALSTWYAGPLPNLRGDYAPMKQEGAIGLGTGGDGSNADIGSFFEGVMTAGYPSDAADNAVQANIVAVGYSGSTNPIGGPVTSATASAAGQAVVHQAGATGLGAPGFSSVYTVDAANGHLQETYLPYMGDSWTTQDLSAKYLTPAVMPGTQPVSVVHCGYTSVFTVDASNGDLQETYLPAIGGPWTTQDLSANYFTPPTNVTPTAVEHYAGASGTSPGCGYTSVYTRDRNGDLQETYLPNAGFPGDRWVTQDLSGTAPLQPGTPQILAGTSPVAIIHCGFTSVYTVDGSNDHLQETYLPAIGGPWTTQDLSANYGAPPTVNTPTAVVHTAGAYGATDDCGFTSVFTVDRGYRHLQETYLPNAGFPGDPWLTHDLSSSAPTMAATPPVAPGTSPVALVHMGFTSVYTVDATSNQLQETYLAEIGGSWTTQSLSANYAAPVTDHTPVVLLHPDASGAMDWTSVFTVNEFNSHLQETYLSNVGFPGDRWYSQDLSSTSPLPGYPPPPGTPPPDVQPQVAASWSVAHAGFTSAFTVDASNGHLQETYLPFMGDSWTTQDLSANYLTPPVAPRSTPAALFHDGYTSVYTVNAANRHLQETYLPAIGGPWHSQDLSANYLTPPVAHDTNPAAIVHDGFVSVFTVDGIGDLWETYLPAIGGPWHSQDLSAKNPGTPPVMPGTSPVVVVHDGYTSAFTVDASNGHLRETYLPFMGDSWQTQDLSAKYGAPPTEVTPAAVLHDGYVSVYTVNGNGDLQETYLPYMGDVWYSQDLTATFPGVAQDINVAPAALYHDGYTSVYYHTGPNDHLVEASLPAIGDPWNSQDMSANFLTPPSVQTPSPLVHYDTSDGLTWASVFTTDASNGDLQETYLPDAGFPGDNWVTQDLSANPPHTPAAQQPGSPLYVPSSGSEYLGYVRMTRLAHAGAANGTLLATFEHSAGNGGMGDYVIQQSTDDGATWSNLSTLVGGDVQDHAPFLFEYPQQLGGYPAGTLMLLGDTSNASHTNVSIREWLSFDHGATWTYKGVVQSSPGGPGDGVWEPFVMIDSHGSLVMLFSDERLNSRWSQFIGEIYSTDGGATWGSNPDGSTRYGPPETQVVASPWQADRPGMPTVAQLSSGEYVLSYEMCGPHACDVYTKTSSDGDFWGSSPSDFGTRAQTSSGIHLQVSPVITSENGVLFLTAYRAFNDLGPYPANQTVILTNTNGGNGPWSWIPAPPIPTAGGNTSLCKTNYSPELTPADNNTSLLYSTAEAAGPYNCQEVTDSVTFKY
jgi:hypothetical protein